MKKIVFLLLSILSAFTASPANKKTEKDAERAVTAQRQSALQADLIAKKKAILNFKLVFVEGGSFTMGCTEEQEAECFAPEKPAHPVFVHAYSMCKYPVTQRQWKALMGKNPSYVQNDDAPVTNVSWNDVQTFIKKLNDFLGKSYRLPTESEWEYAARGGVLSEGKKYSGGDDLYYLGWYKDNGEGAVHDAGKRKPNELGIYDMSGNVWEWCQDYYGAYVDVNKENPSGPSKGLSRVIRGGCYNDDTNVCTVYVRGRLSPEQRQAHTGFRLFL